MVQTGVVEAVGQYYDNFIENSSQIEAIYNIDGEHSFITVDQGSECLYDVCCIIIYIHLYCSLFIRIYCLFIL